MSSGKKSRRSLRSGLNAPLPSTLLEDNLTSKITELTFFCQKARKEVKIELTFKKAKKMKLFVKDLKKRHQYKELKAIKKEGEWTELNNDQKLIIQEKGDNKQYWNRWLQGPFKERLSNKAKVSYIGFYKNGKKDLWGKMVIKDGTYIESGFRDGEHTGKILVVKPNGMYFEGNIDRNSASEGFKKLNGIFRNPVLKRQSMIQKDPHRSKRMCFGKNSYGYAYLQQSRYKDYIGEVTQPDGTKRLGLVGDFEKVDSVCVVKNDYKVLEKIGQTQIKKLLQAS